MLQHNAQCKRTCDLDGANRTQARLLRIRRTGSDRPIQRKLRRAGVEATTVMKVHALPQVEHIGQSIRGNLPRCGELGDRRSIRGELHQSLEHIVVKHFRNGGRRIRRRVENRRLELQSDGYAIRCLHAGCVGSRAGCGDRGQQQRRQQRGPSGRRSCHAVRCNNDHAASAITCADFTISSISTYSSG